MSAKLLRARLVWPVSSPLIENGAVFIHDGVIHDVGPWSELSTRLSGISVEDLAEVVLMPGLVNAHCHLDYTGMAGKIPPPSNFPDWIKSILALKAHWSYTEYAASWVQGAKQLLDSGCTTVFDIEAVPELLPDAWNATPLRIISFLEMTGVRSGHQPQRILAQAETELRRVAQTAQSAVSQPAGLHSASVSPHALYSTPPELLRLVAAKMRAEKIPVSIHLAESAAEFDMYQNASGPLYDWLKTQRPMDDCGGRSPIQQAHRLGLLQPNLLAIHCNHLASGDAELLAKNKVTVVHCPRSHAYFNHARFPYEQLRGAGVNIAFGTDSLASMRPEKNRIATLNMWEEMRHFAKNNPNVSPTEIVSMATTAAAHFLNNPADLIAVSYSGPTHSVAETLLSRTPLIRARYIAGQIA